MKRGILFEIFEIILFLALAVLPIRFFLFEPFFVKGESMEPNFHNWDYLIIDKLTYQLKKPQRGDAVVFHPPFDNDVYYIKRIIGLPNEKIVIEESKITVFNKENPEGLILNEDYLKDHYTSGKMTFDLKNDEYFVLGDNREVSFDSRKWGPIKKENIVGRVFIKISFVNLVKALTK